MTLAATEQDVLKVIAESREATAFEINRHTGLSLGYVEYLCRYLVRIGYLKSVGHGGFRLAPKAKKVLLSLGYELELDREMVKELAIQVAREVAKEIKIENGIRISPEQQREKIQIKTDYNLPVEDESVGLETNIDKIGVKLEKEKGDSLDASVKLLRDIKKKEKGDG